MKRTHIKFTTFLLLTTLVVAACTPQAIAPTATPTLPPPLATWTQPPPTATFTPLSPTATPAPTLTARPTQRPPCFGVPTMAPPTPRPVVNQELPLGHYSITVTAEDMRAMPNPLVGLIVSSGNYTLRLLEEGCFTFGEVNFDEIIDGRYALNQDQIVLDDHRGDRPCPNMGVYQWAFDGRQLTLTVVDDACSRRVWLLTLHPFTKID